MKHHRTYIVVVARKRVHALLGLVIPHLDLHVVAPTDHVGLIAALVVLNTVHSLGVAY